MLPNSHTNLENEIAITLGTIPLSGANITFTGAPSPEIEFPLPPTAPPHEGVFVIPPYPTENNTYPTNEDINLKIPVAPYPVTSTPSAPIFPEVLYISKEAELRQGKGRNY